MDTLDKKFKHRVLYANSNLTWRDFLELAAENGVDYYLETESSLCSDNLMDEPDRFYKIVCIDSGRIRTRVSVTSEEAAYFISRRKFWSKWHKNYIDLHYHGDYNLDYIQARNEAKRKIPEYKTAIDKVYISNKK